jgi:hypothetical protein
MLVRTRTKTNEKTVFNLIEIALPGRGNNNNKRSENRIHLGPEEKKTARHVSSQAHLYTIR